MCVYWAVKVNNMLTQFHFKSTNYFDAINTGFDITLCVAHSLAIHKPAVGILIVITSMSTVDDRSRKRSFEWQVQFQIHVRWDY